MGLIPEFVNILAVAKKYKVSISCYLQSIHQLGAMYDSLSAAICKTSIIFFIWEGPVHKL